MQTRWLGLASAALIASVGLVTSCAEDGTGKTEPKDSATADAGDTVTDGEDSPWTRLIGTPGLDGTACVTIDGQGNVYVGGWTNRGLGDRTYKGGDINDYIVKYGPSGERKWTRLVGVSGQDGLNSAD